MSLLNENEKVLKEAYFVQKLNQFIIYFHLGHKKNEEMKGKTKLLLEYSLSRMLVFNVFIHTLRGWRKTKGNIRTLS